MKVESKSLVDIFTEKSECLGACFCSYSFDSELFENQVLAPILGVESDPMEMTDRFIDECFCRCREVPVVCLVSGQQYMGGQRLPYGLGTVSRRTFHPKVYWLLRKEESVIVVGSGNLTNKGLGLNSELFISLRLSYENSFDRKLLFDMRTFLTKLGTSLDRPELRLKAFLDQLDMLCPSVDSNKPSAQVRFLHTESESSLLDQVFKAIGKVRIRRVSVMAPFFEEDGTHLEGSILWRLIEKGKGSIFPEFHLALPWDDNDTDPPEVVPKNLEGGYDRLWCWAEETEDGGTSIEYWTPLASKGKKVVYLDAEGRKSTCISDEVIKAIEDGITWPLGDIELFAPGKILENIEKKGIRPEIFLFPARHAENDNLVFRPLHAKCLMITGVKADKEYTWVFVGSANASRNALLKRGANVEAGLLWRIPGDVTLTSITRNLVHCPRTQIKLLDRKAPSYNANPALMVKAAVYRARERELSIEWNQSLAKGKKVKLSYSQTVLFVGDNPPSRECYTAFDLLPGCCELQLELETGVYAVPITIENPEALPDGPLADRVVLGELIALYGGRVSREKLSSLRAYGPEGTDKRVSSQLSALFGERFAPIDVFRAWFGLKGEIEEPELSLGGLKVLIQGARGAGVIWDLLGAAERKGELSSEESWFYKLELARTLSVVDFSDVEVFPEEKALLLEETLLWMKKYLKTSKPGSSKTVENRLRGFYL